MEDLILEDVPSSDHSDEIFILPEVITVDELKAKYAFAVDCYKLARDGLGEAQKTVTAQQTRITSADNFITSLQKKLEAAEKEKLQAEKNLLQDRLKEKVNSDERLFLLLNRALPVQPPTPAVATVPPENKRKLTCFKCGGRGHKKDDCRFPDDHPKVIEFKNKQTTSPSKRTVK